MNCSVLIPRGSSKEPPAPHYPSPMHSGYCVLLSPGPSDPPVPIALLAGYISICISSGALATPSFRQAGRSGTEEPGRAAVHPVEPGGSMADEKIPLTPWWGCRFSTLPCAESGQAGPGACHPGGGGRRRSVGSSDLQREQNQSLSRGPSGAVCQHILLGQLGSRGKSLLGTPQH